MKKVTKKNVKTTKRTYDNSGRSDKSAKTQQTIINALVALLAERKGGEVQIEEIAERSKITKRTIFRFFKDKKTLHEAMDKYLLEYLQEGTKQMQDLSFVGFGKNAYLLFEKNESLVLAYLLSPFGQEARKIFRKKLNHHMIEKMKAETNVNANKKNLKRMAVITSLVNAKIWYDLKMDYDYTGEDMQEALDWALSTLLNNLKT